MEKEILKRMCHETAKTIDRQCEREYGFEKFLHDKPRATQVLFPQKKGSTVITKALQTLHQDGGELKFLTLITMG